MKTVIVAALPKRDFCGAAAIYDAPTHSGSWANMCPPCYIVESERCDIGNVLEVIAENRVNQSRVITWSAQNESI